MGQDDNKETYIKDGRVTNGGILGPTGQLGWYTLKGVLDSNPALASYRGLLDASVTATHFKKPLNFQEACARGMVTLVALCFDAAFNGTHQDSYFIQESSDAALATRLGVSSLPSPLFGGAFETDTDPNTGQPIGHLVGVPCGWTEYNDQQIASGGLALQTTRYCGTRCTEEILLASNHTGTGVLFWWWEPSVLIARDLYARISLPRYTDECQRNRDMNSTFRCGGGVTPVASCDYKPDPLYKALSTSLQTFSPLADKFPGEPRIYSRRARETGSIETRETTATQHANGCDQTKTIETATGVGGAAGCWRTDWADTRPPTCPVVVHQGTEVRCGFNYPADTHAAGSIQLRTTRRELHLRHQPQRRGVRAMRSWLLRAARWAMRQMLTVVD